MKTLRASLGPSDRARIDRYLTNVNEIERRIKMIEARNTSGDTRELPDAPAGVPDSFAEHMKLMFDLQVLALQTDMTRVIAFKTGRDAQNRVFPESGSSQPFHPASHHGDNETRDHGVQQDLQVPRRPDGVLPRQDEDHHGRRQEPAREDDGHLGLADGQLEPAQPSPAARSCSSATPTAS